VDLLISKKKGNIEKGDPDLGRCDERGGREESHNPLRVWVGFRVSALVKHSRVIELVRTGSWGVE